MYFVFASKVHAYELLFFFVMIFYGKKTTFLTFFFVPAAK